MVVHSKFPLENNPPVDKGSQTEFAVSGSEEAYDDDSPAATEGQRLKAHGTSTANTERSRVRRLSISVIDDRLQELGTKFDKGFEKVVKTLKKIDKRLEKQDQEQDIGLSYVEKDSISVMEVITKPGKPNNEKQSSIYIRTKMDTENEVTSGTGRIQSEADSESISRISCIQIGNRCVYLDIKFNTITEETFSDEGESISGKILCMISWSDLRQIDGTEVYYITKIKLLLDDVSGIKKTKIEREILRAMSDDSPIDTVEKIVDTIHCLLNGRLVRLVCGCLVLTVVHKSAETAKKLTNSKPLKEIEDFLNQLLITDKIRQVNGNVRLSARILSTEEVDSSKVMEYCFTPDKHMSEMQSAVQVMNAHTTKKQQETLALVEDRLKVANEQISQQLLTMTNEIINQVVSRLQEPKATPESRQSTSISSVMSEDVPSQSRAFLPVGPVPSQNKISGTHPPKAKSHSLSPGTETESAIGTSEPLQSNKSAVDVIHDKEISEIEIIPKDRTGDYKDIEIFLRFLLGDLEDRETGIKSDDPKSAMDPPTDSGSKVTEGKKPSWFEGRLSEQRLKYLRSIVHGEITKMRALNLNKSENALHTIVLLHSNFEKEYSLLKEQFQEFVHLEENVAVITYGGKTEILQPLCGSWEDVVRHIDGLTPQRGEDDFVLEGLLLVLCVMAEYGKIQDAGKYYTIFPKILLIDRFGSISNPLVDMKDILQKMKSFNINPAIFYLGNALDDVSEIFNYYNYQQVFHKLVKSPKYQILESLVAKTTTYIKEGHFPFEDVRMKLEEVARPLIGAGDDAGRGYFKRRVDDALDTPPQLGTRLRWSCPDIYHDAELTGTVVQHFYPGTLLVMLDDGKEIFFLSSYEYKYLIFCKPPDKTDENRFPIGTFVQPGKDWNYDSQQDLYGKVGVVIKNTKDVLKGKARVCWLSSFFDKKIGVYEFQKKEQIKELNRLPERQPVELPGKYVQWEKVDKNSKHEELPEKLSLSLETLRNQIKSGKDMIAKVRGKQVKISFVDDKYTLRDLEENYEYRLVRRDKEIPLKTGYHRPALSYLY